MPSFAINLPAFIITLIVTSILVKGIKEAAKTNNIIDVGANNLPYPFTMVMISDDVLRSKMCMHYLWTIYSINMRIELHL